MLRKLHFWSLPCLKASLSLLFSSVVSMRAETKHKATDERGQVCFDSCALWCWLTGLCKLHFNFLLLEMIKVISDGCLPVKIEMNKLVLRWQCFHSELKNSIRLPATGWNYWREKIYVTKIHSENGIELERPWSEQPVEKWLLKIGFFVSRKWIFLLHICQFPFTLVCLQRKPARHGR